MNHGKDFDMPPVTAAYILPIFFEVGPVLPTGFGPAPLSYSEIKSYQDQTGINLSPWETLALRSMSSAYAHESRQASQQGATPPWVTKDQLPNQEEIQRGVREALAHLSRGRG